LEVVTAVPPTLPTAVQGDPSRIRQVLTNLVGNAIKFTDHGEVTIGARMLTEDAHGVGFELFVRDTGMGIPPERQAAIFESFTQVDGSSTRRHGGTGLGLAISRQLIALMGGTIGVESAPGQGSTFWIRVALPRQSALVHRLTLPSELVGLRVLVV